MKCWLILLLSIGVAYAEDTTALINLVKQINANSPNSMQQIILPSFYLEQTSDNLRNNDIFLPNRDQKTTNMEEWNFNLCQMVGYAQYKNKTYALLQISLADGGVSSKEVQVGDVIGAGQIINITPAQTDVLIIQKDNEFRYNNIIHLNLVR